MRCGVRARPAIAGLARTPQRMAPSRANLSKRMDCKGRHYVANATWLACIANHTVIPAKAGTYAAWVPAFAGMTILCGVCYIMPQRLRRRLPPGS